jgi:cytochrome c oxidase subunit 1
MFFSLGVVVTFGVGGLTGLHLGAVPTNLLLHNTYFVVGHFHLTMAVAALLGAYAATYFWFPKMFGRLMNEKWGKVHFWSTILPILYIFCGMFVVGYAGMQRRIYNPYEYNFLAHLIYLNRYISIAAFIAFFSQFIFLGNFLYSLRKGPVASANPWDVGTLEWTISSPPPFHNFDKIPVVHNGPHEFSHPKLSNRDWISQTEFLEGVSS